MITIRCELLCKEHDLMGYTTYVFKNKDSTGPFDKYIMVTRWPRWEHRALDVGEVGYLTYKEVIAGVDKWWDGDNFIPYNYTNIIFIKFVKEVDKTQKDIIV